MYPLKTIIKRIFPSLCGIALFVFALFGCESGKDLSPIPQIWYKTFYLTDTVDALGNTVKMGILNFDFVDGDGDFGLPTPEENAPPEQQHNLFLNGYFLQNGITESIPADDPISTFRFRIPYFDDQVFGKPYEGTIRVEILFYSMPYNSILYHFYVTDRAGNRSNVEQTDWIINR